MRVTNEAFEAEVLRRSEVYKKKQRTRIKAITGGMLTICLCFGAFGFWRMNSGNHNMLATGNKTANDAEQFAPADSGNAVAQETFNTAGVLKTNGESADGEFTDGVLTTLKPLEIKTEYDAYAPDTTEIVLLITNPNDTAAVIDEDRFTLLYEDGAGNGMGIAHAPSPDESSAAAAYQISAGDTLAFTLDLTQYAMHAPLSAGTYTVSYTDLSCTDAVFTVEAN